MTINSYCPIPQALASFSLKIAKHVMGKFDKINVIYPRPFFLALGHIVRRLGHPKIPWSPESLRRQNGEEECLARL